MTTPNSLTVTLATLAAEPLRALIDPGPGFGFVIEKEEVPWAPPAVEVVDEDHFRFTRESGAGLRSVCSLRLDRAYRVGVYQVTLSNPSGSPVTLDTLHCARLRLRDADRPHLFLCGGASNTGGMSMAREYPTDAFAPRYVSPLYPRRVEFDSGGIGHRRSGSSHRHVPIVMIGAGADDRFPGLFVGLEWSTSWHGVAEFIPPRDDATWQLSLGPSVARLVLHPRQSITMPAVHVGFFDQGFESGTNACRRYIHQCLMPRYQGQLTLPPAAYTLWPGIDVTYTDAELRPHVDAAASIGIEMFTVDADWYAGGFKGGGLGNWDVDRQKFPDGIEAFAEYVQSRGMGLGLYFDASVYRGSRIDREHPDYLLPLPDAFHPRRLNFANREACDFWIDLISDYVRRCDLRYMRADFYADPLALPQFEQFEWELIDSEGKAPFEFVHGLYYVWETLLDRHPNLMLELNSGGGNSIDFGTMSRHYCGWGNDFSGDPHVCRNMQLNANQLFPGHFVGLTVNVDRQGALGGLDAEHLDLAMLSRMAGEFLLCGGLGNMSDRVQQRMRHWVGVYKKLRHLLVKDYYRLLPAPRSEAHWDAGQFCDGRGEGIVLVFRGHGRPHERLYLRDLDPAARYRFRNEGNGREQDRSGDQVLNDGLRVELQPNDAAMWSYRAV